MSNIKNVHITRHPIEIEIQNGTTIQFSIDDTLPQPITLKLECVATTPPPVPPGIPIPGHPNCFVGECLECHNVSCAIHQGFEEMP